MRYPVYIGLHTHFREKHTLEEAVAMLRQKGFAVVCVDGFGVDAESKLYRATRSGPRGFSLDLSWEPVTARLGGRADRWLGFIENRIGDIRCGVHSEMPLCCIAFFIGPWHTMLRGSTWTWYRALVAKAVKKHGDFGYVPCPYHLALRRRVEVKTCLCREHVVE